MPKYDFTGWATRNDLLCSDGRTIRKDAFKDNDGMIVPLVWNHQHDNPENVLGHCMLRNTDQGVRAYGKFNDTEQGINAKMLVCHGDITGLSIYANKLKQNGGNVLHGAIREVSLVLAGANPGAYIDSVLSHGEASDEEAIIFTGEELSLEHAEDAGKETKMEGNKEETVQDVWDTLTDKQKKVVEFMIGAAIQDEKGGNGGEVKHAATEEYIEGETIKDVFDTLTPKQKKVVYALIGAAMSEQKGNSEMSHNIFDRDADPQDYLTHADNEAIFSDVKRYGSLKDTVLAHGIENIDYLFPDDQNVNRTPEFVKREDTWVKKFMNAVHHTPFSRIKSMYANITEDEARAKGYVKGNFKKEEFFAVLKRNTTPTTVYKKQKLERDDVIDIVDFDVVAWIKGEMRMMLDEELARAMLVGDGRPSSSDDKIDETHIRPIWTDDDVYTIKKKLTFAAAATEDQKAKAFIKEVVKARKDYKGSGNPTLYTTEDMLTMCLLMEDTVGRIIYDTVDKLKTALRVNDIVTVPVMENQTRVDTDGDTRTLLAILVNPADYNVGADKGGSVNMFDDFDIDYNAQKYLIETRCSGALIKPYSAIAFESVTASEE